MIETYDRFVLTREEYKERLTRIHHAANNIREAVHNLNDLIQVAYVDHEIITKVSFKETEDGIKIMHTCYKEV